jgi:serine/threonine protein kinase
MTIAAGTQFGPYRLLEKIGSGGMGDVYRALDTRLERAICGDKHGLVLAQDLAAKNPQDTLVQDVFLPSAKAWMALTEGRYAELIDAAHPAKAYDALWPRSCVQGLAYLQLHDAPHAKTAFESALHRVPI